MKTWAIVNNETNVVVNCIVAENQEIADNSANHDLETPLYTAVEFFQVATGWSYVDNNWIAPAE
jgi:hypothetical protein